MAIPRPKYKNTATTTLNADQETQTMRADDNNGMRSIIHDMERELDGKVDNVPKEWAASRDVDRYNQSTQPSSSHEEREQARAIQHRGMSPGASTPQGSEQQEGKTSGYVLISEKLFLFLSIMATLGCILGTAALAVGLAAFVKSNDDDAERGNDVDTTIEDTTGAQVQVSSLLDQILARGHIKCGMGTLQPGFLYEDGVDEKTGEPDHSGFDVDFCRALSGAIFGTPTAYAAHLFPWEERWTKLNTTEVDLVFRSTYSMDRDVYIEEINMGVEFSSPYFYDGMVFAGSEAFVDCAENGTVNGTCADLRICYPVGTTFEEAVGDLFPSENLVGVSGDVIDSFPSNCNVLAADRISVSEFTVRERGYSGSYRVGSEVYTKEPYSFVSAQGDRRWSDFIEFVLQSLIYAEGQGITQETASQMPSVSVFGPEFELMFQNAVAAGGNYGELYERNFGRISPRSGLNLLNGDGVISGPLIWSFPFGNLDVVGPALEDVSPTVRAIKERGLLRCSKVDYNAFASFDPVKRDHVGIDIDLCRAISAALFDGVDRSLFVETDYTHRWGLLTEGKVDIISIASSWTVARDVKEPVSQVGYTFTDPYFYFWQSFAGLPTYVECADNRDVFSPQCQDLRVCTFRNTNYYDTVAKLLGNEFYVEAVDTFPDIVAGLRDGLCNVIYESVLQVEEENVRRSGYGYDFPYTVGTGTYAVEPGGFATGEDDPVWSDFVRWILRALVYAEEEGITQATANLMPRPSIFGPFGTNTFYHAVNAVGNHGEIYERNGGPLPRVGQNRLNNNSEARIFAIAGFDAA